MNRRKQERIERAAERQAYRATLTVEQKIAVALSRRGESKRELAALRAQLEARAA